MGLLRSIWAAAVVLLVATGCATTRATPSATVSPSTAAPLLQPGRPGDETRAIDVRAAVDLTRVGVTQADVRFMRGMIGHHAQAVEMVELLKTRTHRADLKLLGARIEASQRDEMAMMRGWLEARGQAAPDAHADHGAHAHDAAADSVGSSDESRDQPMMPGMLTTAQMSALASASGPAFDRLFLSGMIHHHEGALTMVRELFAVPGAAQDSEMFAFASDVDADQRMEMSRMRALLNELEQESSR